MLASQIIEPGTLVATNDRVSVSVRMPWYRSLPLSSLTGIALSIDGVDVPRESITWKTTDGGSYLLDELAPRHDKWWFVLDSARIEGDLPDLPHGTEYEVHVHIGLHIPYLPVGEGFITIEEQDKKTMEMQMAL
ncbi:conserved hypothetical protein [Arthrobacter sp. 9AX]|uniref:C-glycoside deglycosidase beta subunit domain-containing protein n=1 Tax=Arthrobacter sp. 9AX TaxID=2653131 RepID=UPI0012EF3984|nr:DUF6379 domain-containing protein [Arthrobacter sp. 9AX]VXC24250.1 conserved hypothetical protein [Arthrobacter sp. 9AX]